MQCLKLSRFRQSILSIQNKNAQFPRSVWEWNPETYTYDEKPDPVKEEEPPKKPEDKRPLWYVFPGMGVQWSGMGKELMKIGPFQESVQRSTETLKNAGVDLDKLLAPNNKTIFDNIRDAFNANAAMQVALYDTLTAAGIGPRPKGFFGHSAGEILCAYCDGGITAEEALLIADARGKAMTETHDPKNPGAMAAVILSWEDLVKRLPSTITAACHNGPKGCTISGPKKDVGEFIKKLQKEKIIAVEVNSCGIAAHSPAIEPAKEVYLKYMEEIYKGSVDRYRLDRWIPTSFTPDEWCCLLSRTASPSYFANNLVSPVHFHSAVLKIPKDAVVVEIAPKGIFQSTLKTTVAKSVDLFAPMQSDVANKLQHFVKTVEDIGKAGIYVDPDVLADWKKLV